MLSRVVSTNGRHRIRYTTDLKRISARSSCWLGGGEGHEIQAEWNRKTYSYFFYI
jgi:hypothetical protein